MAIVDHYLLLEDEATGQWATVFDVLDGKLLFHTDGWGATWLTAHLTE